MNKELLIQLSPDEQQIAAEINSAADSMRLSPGFSMGFGDSTDGYGKSKNKTFQYLAKDYALVGLDFGSWLRALFAKLDGPFAGIESSADSSGGFHSSGLIYF